MFKFNHKFVNELLWLAAVASNFMDFTQASINGTVDWGGESDVVSHLSIYKRGISTCPAWMCDRGFVF